METERHPIIVDTLRLRAAQLRGKALAEVIRRDGSIGEALAVLGRGAARSRVRSKVAPTRSSGKVGAGSILFHRELKKQQARHKISKPNAYLPASRLAPAR